MDNYEESFLSYVNQSYYCKLIYDKYPVIKVDFAHENYDFLNDYRSYLSDRYSKVLENEPSDRFFKKLREIKNIETVKVGFFDFIGKQKLSESVYKISLLTDFCFDHSIKGTFLLNDDIRTLNYDTIKNNIIVIGMGKLGGEELNFSSDIDLIFFSNNEFINNEDYADEIVHFFRYLLNYLRTNTEDGFLYRVDMRLRPEGNSGPLIMGINNALIYYKERGRIWEYQAMIKSRCIWGNQNLFNEFKKNMEHFIYAYIPPKTILEEIKDIKDKIEQKVSVRDKEINIKLSEGGIRDIEFIIQFLQMTHGIRYKEIRKPNSIQALDILKTYNIITKKEYDILSKNYITLRKIENILQLQNNLSVQKIPKDNIDIYNLFKNWEIINFDINVNDPDDYASKFRDKLKKIMSEVRKIFVTLFDETIRYIHLKDKILQDYPEIDSQLIENHFKRMDSEYFLRFKESDIVKHIKMIADLSIEKSNLCEINILNENDFFNISIVGFDYSYEFSKIAGLISANYLDIIDGESYTYSEYTESDTNNNEFFYRRQRRQLYINNPKKSFAQNILARRKIVTLMKVRLNQNKPAPDWIGFKNDLNEILILLENERFKEAEEKLNARIFKTLYETKKAIPRKVYPLNIEIDNDSSDLYTILTIDSKDSFAFLYTFTSVLAKRNYYIYKVEITTKNNLAYDRLFIMTKDGNKITSHKKIDELKITVTMIKQYSSLIFEAVNPNNALDYFDDLLTRIFESGNKNELPIVGQKDVQEKLLKVFGISDFIWEDLFRFNYQTFLPFLDDKTLNQKHNKEKLREIFNSEYCKDKNFLEIDFDRFINLLNNYKDAEMFRIDLRQILKKIDFIGFSVELTILAELIIELSFQKIEFILMKEFNLNESPPYAVFGLGKLGGCELGFASDIEIMFIYENSNIDLANYYERMVQLFLKTIIAKREGIFQIDMNLRPYGKKGSLSTSVENFGKYFSDKGEAYFFERQALTKMRFITSNVNGEYLKEKIYDLRDNFVYSNIPPDVDALYKVRKMQLDNYIKYGEINAKFSTGCLVDVEYIVQILQIKYGKLNKNLKKTSTLDGIELLYREKIITKDIYINLKQAYIFFRNLINILRMVKGNAKDLSICSEDSIEFDFLVKRSYFVGIIDKEDKKILIEKLDYFRKVISSYFNKLKEM